MRRILVAVDGSAPSDRAVALAVELAKTMDAGLVILNVVETSVLVPVPMGVMAEVEGAYLTSREVLESAAKEVVDKAAETATMANLAEVIELVKFGPAAKTIVEVAEEEEVEMIVMGRRGLGDLSGLLMGSVSHKVDHISNVPVLTVP